MGQLPPGHRDTILFPPDGGAVSATGKASVAGASLITAMVTLGHHEQTEGVTNITLGSA